MEREIICNCRWGSTTGEVTAWLGATELILRRPGMNGPKRRGFPILAMRNVRLEGPANERLLFEFEKQTVSLSLGTGEAKIWADVLRRDGPMLPLSDGVQTSAADQMLGKMQDASLEAALHTSAEAGRGSRPRNRAGRHA